MTKALKTNFWPEKIFLPETHQFLTKFKLQSYKEQKY